MTSGYERKQGCEALLLHIVGCQTGVTLLRRLDYPCAEWSAWARGDPYPDSPGTDWLAWPGALIAGQKSAERMPLGDLSNADTTGRMKSSS